MDDDARPADSLALPDSPRPGSEDERGVIGENFCQPPLLLPPPREPAELPLLAVSWLLPIERSFADLSLDDLSPDDLSFDDRVFADPLFNDLPFDAVAVAPRAEKKC
jgi:hypothetical protein